MNLSKSEKLLAAKKKLREFQLSKMVQDGCTKEKHHSTDLPSEQYQNIQVNKSDVEIINNVSTAKVPKSNIQVLDQDLQENKVIPVTSMTDTENIVNHEKVYNSVNEVVKPIQETPDINLKVEIEEETELSNFPKVQKEHLLEMASAVQNILTNDFDSAETTLNNDLVCRNQFLNSYVEEQKKIVAELHLELSNSRSRISELEAKLETKNREFQMQLARELNPLKEQLQVHTQTTGILIAEKAELSAALNQVQQTARKSTEEIEEIMGKFKNSQVRIIELEKEMTLLKGNNEELRKNFHLLQTEYDALDKKHFELKKEKEDLNLERSELKQKLNLKKTELIAIQQELQEKTALLSLSELRIQQLKGATSTEEDRQDIILLQQELAQAKESLKVVNAEKDEANKQYQNYVKQLDAQQVKLLDEIKGQNKTIEELHLREQSYIQRLSELELQLQQEREKVEKLVPLQACKDKIDTYLKIITELTLVQERLHITLSEKDAEIEMLTRDINHLRESSNQEAEVTKLANALQSEQLGASRAIHQNRQLKEQLTDMENAFVSLSNAKLDLTEQLQGERSIGRKLNAQLNKVETELEELKEKLQEKEAILEEFEKERLQSAQIADQIQHYQAQSHHVNTFQQELQNASAIIEKLEREKQELMQKLQERYQDNTISQNDPCSANNDTLIEDTKPTLKKRQENDIAVMEPVKQLEQRFKETMERVVELTEEKQKLEHLVLQLQSETETIGEYITLYQKQRAVLQSRAREREQIFRQLLEQRNHQQEQLHKLKVLVSDFLRREYIHANSSEHTIKTDTDFDEDIATVKKAKETMDIQIDNKNVSELLDVLSDIKDCKDSCMFEPNFHPCPWCSGKLLTV